MKQFAVIGLGTFGMRIIDELVNVTDEIIIVDKDSVIIEKYKDKVKSAYVTDALNEESLKHIIPASIDAVIVDLGSNIEVSILVTNYLKKIGVKKVIVKAGSDNHGEVLKLVGADEVIYPDLEAARKVAPVLVSPLIFNFIPISKDFVMAEVKVPIMIIGQTLIEANLRQKYSINILAIRLNEDDDYNFVNPDTKFLEDSILLIAGKESDIIIFSGKIEHQKIDQGDNMFKKLFSKNK